MSGQRAACAHLGSPDSATALGPPPRKDTLTESPHNWLAVTRWAVRHTHCEGAGHLYRHVALLCRGQELVMQYLQGTAGGRPHKSMSSDIEVQGVHKS